jgi:hypothetical protein
LGYGAPYAGGGGPAGGGGYGSYEFNDLENQIIDKTAARAKLWGIFSTTLGVLQLFGSCGAIASPMMAGYFPAGVIAIIIGVTFIGVSNSLKMVVQTQGNDVGHMMQALQKMGSAFLVQIVCTVIGFVLAVTIFFIVAFVLVAAVAAS